MKHAIVICLGIAASLSGCVNLAEAPSGGNVPPEWRECRWTYPDGSPLACNGTATSLTAEARRPGWGCVLVDSFPQGILVLLRSTATGEGGIYYQVDSPSSARGVVAITSTMGTSLYSWANLGNSGFLRMGEPYPEEFTLTEVLYHSELESNHPGLVNASIEQAWSWFNDQLWVVHRANGPNGTYLLHKVSSLPFGGTASWSSFEEREGPFFARVSMKYWTGGYFEALRAAVPHSSCFSDEGLRSYLPPTVKGP